MKSVIVAVVVMCLGLAACEEKLEPQPGKPEWSYQRTEDGIRGTTRVVASRGSVEVGTFESSSAVPAYLNIRQGGADGDGVWLASANGLMPFGMPVGGTFCAGGYMLVKIANAAAETVKCDPNDRQVYLDPSIIPRVKTADKVVIEIGQAEDGRPVQLTFEITGLTM